MRYRLGIVALIAASMSAFSQNANVVEVPYDGSTVKKELTFRPVSGGGDEVVVEVEFQKQIPTDTFSITFKSSPRHAGKYLYFFGGEYQIKAVTKACKNLWFDKSITKSASTVIRFYGSSMSEGNIFPKKSVQYFKMDSADFTIKFTQNGWNGNLYAYVVENHKKGKCERHVKYLAKVPLDISSANPCVNNMVRNKIEKLNNLSNEKNQVILETSNLKKLSCMEYKAASFEPKHTEIDADCPACKYCPEYVALRNAYAAAVNEYLDAVREYNANLADIAKRYAKPCADPCACNCAKFKEIREKVGSLLWDMQTGRTDKAKANEELKKIQSALPCSGTKCKDCEANCKTCDSYKAYKKDCDELKKLLK